MNFVLIGLLDAYNQFDVVMPHNQKLFETLLILVIRFGWLLFNKNSLLQDFCQTEYGKSRFITPRRLVVSFIDGNELNQKDTAFRVISARFFKIGTRSCSSAALLFRVRSIPHTSSEGSQEGEDENPEQGLGF